MKNYKAKNVDEYIAGAVKSARPKLKELRALIKATVPKVHEKIAWGVPIYMHHGLLIGLAWFEHHVSIGLGAANLVGKERKELEKRGYTTGKKIIQIKFDQKVPVVVIRRMLKARARRNEAKK